MAIITTNKNRTYSDLDLNFTAHPIRKDINKVTNELAVINAVKNLILTNHYERPFRPDLGSNLRKMLFEPMDKISSATIERELYQVLTNYEPRITVNSLILDPNYDKNGYDVSLQFTINNTTNPIAITFFLSRVR